MRFGALAALMLAAILTACGSSPPSRCYELSAESDPPAAGQAGYPIGTVALGEVTLPGALDRPQIARQIGPNQLEYAESDRRAGPRDEMTRRVLSADLRPLLSAGMALVANDSSAPAALTIAVEASRFDADKTGRVTLQASWETLDKNAKVIGMPREANVEEFASGSDAAAVAATMSRAVARLADNIATGIGGAGVGLGLGLGLGQRQCIDRGPASPANLWGSPGQIGASAAARLGSMDSSFAVGRPDKICMQAGRVSVLRRTAQSHLDWACPGYPRLRAPETKTERIRARRLFWHRGQDFTACLNLDFPPPPLPRS